jgi:hypothetical protein
LRRKIAVLCVAAFVSIFGAAACGGVGEDVRQRAEDEVRQQADEEIQRMRTQVENEVEKGLTQAEEQVREGQQSEGQ